MLHNTSIVCVLKTVYPTTLQALAYYKGVLGSFLKVSLIWTPHIFVYLRIYYTNNYFTHCIINNWWLLHHRLFVWRLTLKSKKYERIQGLIGSDFLCVTQLEITD